MAGLVCVYLSQSQQLHTSHYFDSDKSKASVLTRVRTVQVPALLADIAFQVEHRV
jgi:hypothetical protein